MTAPIPERTSRVISRYWPWFFFAAAFESLIFAVKLLAIPSEGGLSPARLGLLSILIVSFGLSVYLGYRARRGTAWLDSIGRTPFIGASALLALAAGLALFLLRYADPQGLRSAYERLSPVLCFLVILGVQSAGFLLLTRNGFDSRALAGRQDVYRSALLAFLVLMAVVLIVSITRLGVTRDTAYWGEPGVAILGWHFALSILVGFAFLIYSLRMGPQTTLRFKILAPLAIWLTAALLWLSVPWDVLQNSFYAPISPPADVPFPYSDAGFYDSLAQSLLIGTDYFGGIPPRPLYIIFLAGLHAVFGQNYAAIITAQTLVLALFPVALYLLAQQLHSPAAGLTAALFAIFREYLGLWISSQTRVVNSRVLTTDFPTALGIAVLCLVLLLWFERRDLRTTLLAGGTFGLLLLLRTQSLLILPIVLVLAWFVYRRQTRQWMRAGAVFLLATALTISSWLVHNYTVTGRLAFDDPDQMAVIYSQYSYTANLDISQFDFEQESLGSRLINFTLQNPGYVAGFVANHFLNTEIGALLALPLIERYDGLFAPVNLYWVSWPASLAWYNQLLLVFYLAVIAVGLGAAWQRAGWIGLTPLAVNLGYALANGVSRFSSWRYNLPVDWAGYFYFAMGAVEILGGAASLFGLQILKTWAADRTERSIQNENAGPGSAGVNRRAGSVLLIILAFGLAGAIPWLARGLAAPRYTASPSNLIAQLASRGLPAGEIQTFLAQPDAILLEGRLMYPRMYRREDGMVSANPWPAYRLRAYPRIGFIVLNNNQYNAIFPTRDLLDFPHGSDAVVLACQREDYLEVRWIALPGGVFSSAPLLQSCD